MAIFLFGCGPVEPVPSAPKAANHDLVINQRAGGDRSNKVTLLSTKSPNTQIVNFNHTANRDGFLMLESLYIDVERESNCGMEVEYRFGEKGFGKKEFVYSNLTIRKQLPIQRGFDYRILWVIKNMKDCGQVDIEFSVASF
tara:strand:+ start:201188 stop:201610 length:423 start_codon:yes stop_codon:yes gene_type:complete